MPKNFRSLRSRSCFLVKIRNFSVLNDKLKTKLRGKTSVQGKMKKKRKRKKEEREKKEGEKEGKKILSSTQKMNSSDVQPTPNFSFFSSNNHTNQSSSGFKVANRVRFLKDSSMRRGLLRNSFRNDRRNQNQKSSSNSNSRNQLQVDDLTNDDHFDIISFDGNFKRLSALEKERERLSLSKSESSIFDWSRNSIEARSMGSVLSKGNQLVDVNQNEVIFRPFFQFQMDDSNEE